MVSTFLHLFRLVLWPSIWSILENMVCVPLEMNVLLWNVIRKQCMLLRSLWSLVFLTLLVSLWILYMDNLNSDCLIMTLYHQKMTFLSPMTGFDFASILSVKYNYSFSFVCVWMKYFFYHLSEILSEWNLFPSLSTYICH